MGAANARIAIDLPSGVGMDDGALLGASLPFDMTIALAALKPAHLLYPAAGLCGRIVTADIGIQVETRCWRITKPRRSRSEERRVGKGGLSTCRSWGSANQ